MISPNAVGLSRTTDVFKVSFLVQGGPLRGPLAVGAYRRRGTDAPVVWHAQAGLTARGHAT